MAALRIDLGEDLGEVGVDPVAESFVAELPGVLDDNRGVTESASSPGASSANRKVEMARTLLRRRPLVSCGVEGEVSMWQYL